MQERGLGSILGIVMHVGGTDLLQYILRSGIGLSPGHGLPLLVDDRVAILRKQLLQVSLDWLGKGLCRKIEIPQITGLLYQIGLRRGKCLPCCGDDEG